MAYIQDLRKGTILQLEESVDFDRVSTWRDGGYRCAFSVGARFEVVDPQLAGSGKFSGRVMVTCDGSDPPMHFAIPVAELRSFRVV